MAASLINKLTNTKPSLRFLASLNTALASKSVPRIAGPELGSPETLILGEDKLGPPSSSSSRSSQIVFPSFPFGYCLNPRVSPNRSDEVESESDSEGSRTIWADSTKQKRKKKMNKHKYQKRRKLLRRKS